MSVIGNTDQRFPAILHANCNVACIRIQRVFNEFLHRRGGAFNHLAGCNAVNRTFIELSDLWRDRPYVGVGSVHAPRFSMAGRDSAMRISIAADQPFWLPNHHKVKVLRLQQTICDAHDVLLRDRVDLVVARVDI